MKHNFEISGKEFGLAGLILVMGLLFYSRFWLTWLDTLNPFYGMLVYYAIILSAFGLLSLFGFRVFDIDIKNIVQVLGLVLIFFSFATVTGWSSAYVQYATKGNFEGASTVYFQCEDGVMWWLYYEVIGITNIQLARILAFSVTPFILTLLGVLFVEKGDIWL